MTTRSCGFFCALLLVTFLILAAITRIGFEPDSAQRVREESFIWCIGVSSDETYLLAGTNRGTVHVYDLKTRTKLNSIDAHASGVMSIAVSPDGLHFASTGLDRKIQVRRIGDLRSVASLEAPSRVMRSAFLSKGSLFVSAGGGPDKTEGDLVFWDVPCWRQAKVIGGLSNWVVTCLPVERGQKLLIKCENGPVELWDGGRMIKLEELPINGFGSHAVAYGPTSRTVLLFDRSFKQSEDGYWLVRYGLDDKKLEKLKHFGRDGVSAVALSSDEKTIAFAHGYGPGAHTLTIYHLESRKVLHSLNLGIRISSLRFLDNGEVLVLAGGKGFRGEIVFLPLAKKVE